MWLRFSVFPFLCLSVFVVFSFFLRFSFLEVLESEASDWSISKNQFPKDFIWGSATSAYQVEGAVKEGGRGESIWDEIVRMPGVISDGKSGDVAVDHFHRFREDIDLMADMGMGFYRFSISWPRIIPDGEGEVNFLGIDFYNRVIDALLEKGIEPVVTLFHWDLPLPLHRKYGGWINESIVPIFAKYAKTCFENFGDRVKFWITFNEPRIEYQREFSTACYPACTSPPLPCSHLPPSFPCDCSSCLSYLSSSLYQWIPYKSVHVIILSHSEAAHVYNTLFKPVQKGKIGITLDCEWAEPMTLNKEDVEASHRYLLFNLGWFLYPLLKGEYPEVMRDRVSLRLPLFREGERERIKNSIDFLGLNHYTSRFAQNDKKSTEGGGGEGGGGGGYYDDIGCFCTEKGQDGKEIGPKAGSDWLYVFSPGIKNLLLWLHKEFPNFPIYVTENGVSDGPNQNPESYLDDKNRVHYYSSYIKKMGEAIKEGVNVKGYFAWSTVDNFEWKMGYTERFGLHFIDYEKNLTRIPKKSAKWWKHFLLPENDKKISSLEMKLDSTRKSTDSF